MRRELQEFDEQQGVSRAFPSCTRGRLWL
eukprot:COSAG01_NODE_75598_length_194_cov_100.305263_1_plen_28_part_01